MKATFALKVTCIEGIVFEDQVESVYLSGAEGEFELLPFHHPILAALPEGEIKIAHKEGISIKVGVVYFKDNTCLIITEPNDPTNTTMKTRW